MIGHLQRIGDKVIDALEGVGNVAFLLRDTTWWLFRAKPNWREFISQLYFVGVESLPVVLYTGAVTGMVLAYSSYAEFLRLGVASWTGPLVAKGLTQQLAPVLAGIMLAGRVGCNMAASLGYMNVSDQVDALKTLGTDPVKYLVVPRVVAFTVMTPLLTAFAMLIGITGGLALCIYGLGAEQHFMWKQTVAFMDVYDYVQGLIKAVFFGLATGLICCHKGITASGGANGVGKATTEANVASCITILALNLYLTMVLGIWSPE